MGLIKGILIYKYAKRRTNKKRDREQDCSEAGSWDEEICNYCGRTNEEHLDDDEPCS
jgi:hypothetical protein